MNKKIFAVVMSVIFVISVLSGTVVLADAALTENSLTTDESSITNTDYQNQALKSIVAFFTDDYEAEKYEVPEDIIILDIGASIQESYPVTIPTEHKDYIVIIFNGIDKVSVRTVVALPHDHIPGGWVNSDPDNHWKSCTTYGCNEKLEIASHQLPGTVDSDCTTPVLCECGYVMEAGALNHTFTDDFDLSCNNAGCTYTRSAEPVNVTFNVNGGNALAGNVLVTNESGKLSTLPVPTRNGYSFEGWYTAQTGGTKVEVNSTVFTVDTTVYAHWKGVFSGSGSFSSGGGGGSYIGNPTYTITFETNGGTAVDAIKGTNALTIYLGDFVTSKEGYVFAGWFEDAACNKPIEKLAVKSNAKVYAKWVPAENEQDGENAPSTSFFSDVSESDWYYDSVAFVKETGIMNGISDTEFAPHNTTTRAMLVTMLYRLEGEPELVGDDAHIVPMFSDVSKDSYYEKAVVWASDNEIAGGYGDGIFGAENPITREQLASILYRYAAHKAYDTDSEGADLLSFDDASEISEYAYPALAWACKNGIINGDGNKLMPTGSAERCQVAAMLMRFSTLLEK